MTYTDLYEMLNSASDEMLFDATNKIKEILTQRREQRRLMNLHDLQNAIKALIADGYTINFHSDYSDSEDDILLTIHCNNSFLISVSTEEE